MLENWKRRVKNNEADCWAFAALLGLNLLFYGMFVMPHYAADTYYTEAVGWTAVGENYYVAGRWLELLFCRLCEFLPVSFSAKLTLSWGIGILSVSAAAFVVYRLLGETLKDAANMRKVWHVLLSFMMVSNVFLLEDFIFAEFTGMMCLGILFDVLGAKYVIKSIKERNVKFYAFGILFGILGVNGHQGNFAILAVLCVLFVEDTFDGVKQFIKNNLIIGSAYALPVLVNFLQTRIGGTNRAVQGGMDILASFLKASRGVLGLLRSTANLLPPYFYCVCVLIFGGLFVICAVQKKNIKALVFGIYYAVIAALGVYAPLMATELEYIDVAPRTVYILGGIIPVILIAAEVHFARAGMPGKMRMWTAVFAVLFLAVQYRGLLKIETAHFKANAADHYEAQIVADMLREHEEETGVRVTKMAIYWDDSVTGQAPGVAGYGIINERMLANDWAGQAVIHFYTGYELGWADKSEEIYQEYFEGKNWNQIEEEQMVIVGDTAHFCAY